MKYDENEAKKLNCNKKGKLINGSLVENNNLLVATAFSFPVKHFVLFFFLSSSGSFLFIRSTFNPAPRSLFFSSSIFFPVLCLMWEASGLFSRLLAVAFASPIPPVRPTKNSMNARSFTLGMAWRPCR